MTEILLIVLTVFVLLTLGLVLWVIKGLALVNSSTREHLVGQGASINLLQQQLEAIRTSQTESAEKLGKNLQAGQESIGKYLQSSQKTLSDLHKEIGAVQGAGQQMLRLGADVRSLQDILKNPKLRGQMGERSLANLLAEILPSGSFIMQHTFKNGRIVDALVKLPDYCVPIDAKFPLPTFEAMLKAEDDEQRSKLRRQFQADVTKHIDKIAASYILPEEGTLDFALMYIPAENVYYETIINYASDKTDVMNYALGKKVIPVSPNLLYAYLMTIVMGLHGLQIEKQAARIRQNLSKIAAGFEGFTGTWEVLGKHLRNAQGQYDEGRGKLDKFKLQLDQIQISDEMES